MCGICGVYSLSSEVDHSELLVKMREVLVTRGPDADGIYRDGGLTLGHTRLAILDLSENGQQPMANEDGKVQIVFNGEIYNFQGLREELLTKGHIFRSECDTEVLIHGYEEWGVDGLTKRIRGMFAFAIWDANLNKLFLVRDHLGKKPLFYCAKDDEISFSSDIKSLQIKEGENLNIEAKALNELLYYYFITQQRSIYKEVKKVPPGHYLEYSEEGLSIHQYWAPNYKVKEDRSTEDWLELFDQKFREAIRRRLISDVPIGAFLSGGLDSSVICAVMAEESSGSVKTFCAGYGEETPLDERRFARKVAKIIGTEHSELEIDSDVSSELSRIIWHYGEPYADSSAIPSYLIAAEARKHVTVVLTGDGGDEGFAGYSRYKSSLRSDHLPSIAKSVGLPIFNAVLGGALSLAPDSFFLRRMEQLSANLSGESSSHARFLCVWDGVREQILGSNIRHEDKVFSPVAGQSSLLESLSGNTAVDQSLEYVLRQRLPSDYLTKVDVATMAHSLEARSPFLDVDLLELAMKIPSDVLLKNGQSKYLIKQYAKRWLPDDLVHRKKAGFEVPIADWFRSTWKEGALNLLQNGVACREGFFDPKAVLWLYNQHLAGKSYANQLWSLLVFEIWLRLFVDKTLKPGDPVFDL